MMGEKSVSVMLFPTFMREENIGIIFFLRGSFPINGTEKHQYHALSQLWETKTSVSCTFPRSWDWKTSVPGTFPQL